MPSHKADSTSKFHLILHKYASHMQGLKVAIKTLTFPGHSEIIGPQCPSQRVLMEAALSKSIVHPNIVSTYHCIVEPVPVRGSRDMYIVLQRACNRAFGGLESYML